MHPENFPGLLSLHGPYAQHVLLLDKRCPVAFINDAKDTGVDPNVVIEQREHLAKLGQQGNPWHTLFQVRALRAIRGGEELVVQLYLTITYCLRDLFSGRMAQAGGSLVKKNRNRLRTTRKARSRILRMRR